MTQERAHTEHSAGAYAHGTYGTYGTYGTPIAIRARGLGKSYGTQWALRGIDLDVEAGESVALFGGNGAGKSTLLRLLATLTSPSIGSLQLLGVDVARGAHLVRGAIGVVGDKSYLYSELTAAENLELYASLYRVEWNAERTKRALAAVGLSVAASKRVRDFSRGMQQRLALARAALHRPAVLLLDEPDSGLDAGGIACLQQLLLAERKSWQTVVLATHNLELGLGLAGGLSSLSTVGWFTPRLPPRIHLQNGANYTGRAVRREYRSVRPCESRRILAAGWCAVEERYKARMAWARSAGVDAAVCPDGWSGIEFHI